MKHTLSALLAVALALPVLAQNTLTTTTLGQAVTPTQQVLTLASVSAVTVSPATMIYIDREAMRVVALNGGYVTVSRGAMGTRALSHLRSARVLIGNPNWFSTDYPDPTTCSAATALSTPYVNVITGTVYNCDSAGVWTPQVDSTFTSNSFYNAFVQKLTGPSFTAANYGSYASYWIDQGGFPVASVVGAPNNLVPRANEVLRVSQKNDQGRGNAFSAYLGLYDGSLGGIPLYAQGSAFTDSQTALVYGGNVHVSECEGFKCNGTNYPDHDIGSIGFEIDSEIRSTDSGVNHIGLYVACVNCKNNAAATAFSIDANKSVGSFGDSAYKPWVTGISSTPGAISTHGLFFNPTLDNNNPVHTGAAKSDSPDISLCAYTDNVPTRNCATMQMLQSNIFTFTAPGSRTQFLTGDRSALSVVQAQYNYTAKTAAADTLVNTDLGGVISNAGATGTVVETLPTPAAGVYEFFYVQAAQTLRVKAAAATIIRNNITASAAAGTIESNVIGNWILLVGQSATTWSVAAQRGTWIMDGTTAVNAGGEVEGINGQVLTANTGAAPTYQYNLPLMGNGGGFTVASGATAYTGFGMNQAAFPTASSTTRAFLIPYACTLQNFQFQTLSAQAAANSTAVTVLQNAAPTAITITSAASDPAQVYADSTHTVTLAAGDRVSIQMVQTGGSASPQIGAMTILCK